MDFSEIKRISSRKPLFALLVVLVLPLFALGLTLSLTGKRQVLTKEAAEFEPVAGVNDEYVLDIPNPVFGFYIDGNVNLEASDGFLRVILVDKDGNEYQVYETSPLLSDKNSFSVARACDETCLLDSVVPAKLRIEKQNASFELKKTSFDSVSAFKVGSTEYSSQKTKLAKEKEKEKIQKINEQIKKKGLRWTAGGTSVSSMTYAQKKKPFFDPKTGQPVKTLPDLQGFEYYKGGIFEYISSENHVLQASATDCQGNGKALWLTGDNSYVSVREKGEPLIADDFTIEVWTKLLFPTFMQTIVSRFSSSMGRQYRLSEIFIPGKEKAGLRFEVGNTATNSADLISEGEWTHLAVTRLKVENKNIIKGYINGALVLQKEDLFEGEDLNNCLVNIGAGNVPTDNDYFIGLIDELRVSNVVRNIEDNWQRGVYSQPLAVDQKTLALWRFEDNLDDSSGNNFNGTAVGNISYNCGRVPNAEPTGTPTLTPPPLPPLTPPVIPTSTPTPSPTVTPTPTATPVPLNLPSSWDWRNVHGENWNTSVKNQGNCGSCWAFADVGAVEAVVNLYYNQHVNLDLSEQDLVSCSGGGSCNGGWLWEALAYIRDTGIVPETCFPYTAKNSACQKCTNWQNLLTSINSFFSFSPAPVYLKKGLIEKGPLSSAVTFYGGAHAMALVGWKTDTDKTPIWIFKNSWGTGWGEEGYIYFKGNIWQALYIIPPVTIADRPLQITCVDKDKDGYCNWGISETKPSACPSSCKPEKDCNDADPSLGPFDANYRCVVLYLTPTPTRRPTSTPTRRPTPTKTKIPTRTPTPTPRPARIQGRLYYDRYSTLYRTSSLEIFGPVGFRMDYYDPYQKRFIIGGASQACTDKCSPVCKSLYGNGSYSTPKLKPGGYQLRLVLNNSKWKVTEAYLSNGTACLRNRIGGVNAAGLGTYLVNVYGLELKPGEVMNVWFGVKPR